MQKSGFENLRNVQKLGFENLRNVQISMKRKIYNRLLEWKEKDLGTTAVLIEGARRIGKSYIAEEFGRNEYDS